MTDALDDDSDAREILPLLARDVSRNGAAWFTVGGKTYTVLRVPEIVPAVVRQATPKPHARARLTPAQVRMLVDKARGMTSVAIARRHHIAKNTVEQHLSIARRAYGVNTTAEAVEHARQDGYLK